MQLEQVLGQAAEQYQNDGIRTIVVVDGLDHVPREERPQRSFLNDFPLPDSIPEGVIFLLGTQRVDLIDLPASVKDQASEKGRLIQVSPLRSSAVARLAELAGVSSGVDGTLLYKKTSGHPLAVRYVIDGFETPMAQKRDRSGYKKVLNMVGMLTFSITERGMTWRTIPMRNAAWPISHLQKEPLAQSAWIQSSELPPPTLSGEQRTTCYVSTSDVAGPYSITASGCSFRQNCPCGMVSRAQTSPKHDTSSLPIWQQKPDLKIVNDGLNSVTEFGRSNLSERWLWQLRIVLESNS